MYKVLIADDEDIICRGLAGLVSKRPELQVVALAEDGEIALEKARETRPDLMFVDINMPFLNGLEFVEQIRRLLPEALIIIVTGYDDFAYVQKALQLGVADYVLKPVMEEPFFQVLDKAVLRLEGMHASRDYISWMEEWVAANRPRMIDDFLHRLLEGQITGEELEKQAGYLKIRISEPYAVTALHIYGERGGEEEALGQDGDAWYLACCSLVQSCFQPYSEALCCQTEEGAVVVISEDLEQESWKKLEQELREQTRSRLGGRLELVRKQGSRREELPKIFEQVMGSYGEQSHYSELVRQAMAIVREQWGDRELSLQSVADTLFVSAPYLSRVFRQETGENFAAFLARKRIREAKLLLKSTEMKMYEIAQKTGYTSQHYFSNVFKKAVGIAPADYRKNIRK